MFFFIFGLVVCMCWSFGIYTLRSEWRG